MILHIWKIKSFTCSSLNYHITLEGQLLYKTKTLYNMLQILTTFMNSCPTSLSCLLVSSYTDFLLFLELVTHASIFHANNSNLCRLTFLVRPALTILKTDWPACTPNMPYPSSVLNFFCSLSPNIVIYLFLVVIACLLPLECKHWHPIIIMNNNKQDCTTNYLPWRSKNNIPPSSLGSWLRYLFLHPSSCNRKTD